MIATWSKHNEKTEEEYLTSGTGPVPICEWTDDFPFISGRMKPKYVFFDFIRISYTECFV